MSFRPARLLCSNRQPHKAHQHTDGPDGYTYTCEGVVDMCHNGHPFKPGEDTDMEAEGRSPDPTWCNVCGEKRPTNLREALVAIKGRLDERSADGEAHLFLNIHYWDLEELLEKYPAAEPTCAKVGPHGTCVFQSSHQSICRNSNGLGIA